MSEAMRSRQDDPSRREGGGSSSRLHPLASVALLLALNAQRTEGDVDSDVRALLVRACNEARAQGIRAEQLLVVLKHVWYDLPEIRHAPRHDGSSVLARVITICIHEYYRQ